MSGPYIQQQTCAEVPNSSKHTASQTQHDAAMESAYASAPPSCVYRSGTSGRDMRWVECAALALRFVLRARCGADLSADQEASWSPISDRRYALLTRGTLAAAAISSTLIGFPGFFSSAAKIPLLCKQKEIAQ